MAKPAAGNGGTSGSLVDLRCTDGVQPVFAVQGPTARWFMPWISKGWGNKNEDFQKTEMALEGEPFVLEGCPFHSL